MSDPATLQRLSGAVLDAVRVLMTVLCGGCGALIVIAFAFGGIVSGSGANLGIVGLPLLLGGLLALAGLGLLTLGRRMRARP